MIINDRENYEKFFNIFGTQLKFGCYNDFGMNKENLKDLILFYSSTTKNLTTLKEYVSRMKEDQDKIYYACRRNNRQNRYVATSTRSKRKRI